MQCVANGSPGKLSADEFAIFEFLVERDSFFIVENDGFAFFYPVPLHDRVIVKRMEEERTSPGGIVIPDAATEKPIKGEVIAVGNGKLLDSGDVRALDVKAGDRVLFGKWSGTEVKLNGEDLLIMKESDIMGIIE